MIVDQLFFGCYYYYFGTHADDTRVWNKNAQYIPALHKMHPMCIVDVLLLPKSIRNSRRLQKSIRKQAHQLC